MEEMEELPSSLFWMFGANPPSSPTLHATTERNRQCYINYLCTTSEEWFFYTECHINLVIFNVTTLLYQGLFVK